MAKKPVPKITAPKTYNPGKGRPKEHLAYLNEREMAYLRSINGNNMERGPRNLPSFPPDDAIGSSSNAGGSKPSGGSSSGGSKGSSTAGNSPQNGGRGAGSNYGSGSGRPGTGSGGSYGGGNKGSGGSSATGGGNKGTSSGGMRGAGSNTGPGSARPGSDPNAGSKGTASGGQRGAGSNTGPGSGRPDAGGFSRPSGASSASRDKVDRETTQVRDAKVALGNTPAVNKDLSLGGIRSLNVGPMGTPVKVGGGFVSQASTPKTSISKSVTEAMKAQYGAYKNPDAPAQTLVGDAERERIEALNKAEQEIRDMYGEPEEVSFDDRLKAAMTPISDISAPPSPEKERIVSIEDVPPERPRYAAGTYTSPYDVRAVMDSYPGPATPQKYTSVTGGLGFTGFNTTPPDERLVSTSPTKAIGSKFSGKPSSIAFRESLYGSPKPSKTRGIGESLQASAPPSSNPMQDDSVAPEDEGYISPTTQMPPEKLPETPLPVRIFEGTTVGKFGKAMHWGVGKEYANATPAEQAAMLHAWNDRNKEYLAGRSGPQDRSDFETRGVTGGGSGGFGGSGSGNGTDSTTGGDTSSTTGSGGGRPAIYFYWDVGMNLPSPGEATYPLYQKYLRERAAAEAGMSRYG